MIKNWSKFIFVDYTKILKINLFAFAYRLFHEDFSPIDGNVPSNGEKSS